MHFFNPEEILVERASMNSTVFRRLRQALPEVPFKMLDEELAAGEPLAQAMISLAEPRNDWLSLRTKVDF